MEKDNLTTPDKSVGTLKSADIRTAQLVQKTELVSELAGAIANQFNNIMMAITGYAEVELKKAALNERRSLEQVLSNAARATLLVQKLLAFSRKQIPSPQPVELNAAITNISELLRQLVGEQVEVVVRLDPHVRRINADCGELEQLVLSLALNARNAMTEGGKLTVSTELVNLDEGFVGTNGGAVSGKYAMLAICDTPAGRVPGKTTKDEGKQDLRISDALPAIRRIVEDAHGLIRISRERNVGTSFEIYFPAQGKDAAEGKKNTLPKNVEVAKTILVVEDDDAVRVPAAEFLMMEGFKVLQARTGAEALHVATQNRSQLDLLITDIVMPEMSGHEVAATLVEMHPELKVLYMSGDAAGAGFSEIARVQPSAILQKPFRLNKLKDKIHEVLGQ
jgi:two-component system cell cycle sensor histidine kinase/response regulator CckA